jgi:hypothetical protein
MFHARYPGLTGQVRPTDSAASGVRLSHGPPPRAVPCGHRHAPEASACAPPDPRSGSAQAVHPSLQPGDVLAANRGLCSYAHLTRLDQAGPHAVLRLGARQIVNFTPGRPFVRPGVRRTSAVKGIPRSQWLTAVGVHDQLVVRFTLKTYPSWLAWETLAALPDSLVLREMSKRSQVNFMPFDDEPKFFTPMGSEADLWLLTCSTSTTRSGVQGQAPPTIDDRVDRLP